QGHVLGGVAGVVGGHEHARGRGRRTADVVDATQAVLEQGRARELLDREVGELLERGAGPGRERGGVELGGRGVDEGGGLAGEQHGALGGLVGRDRRAVGAEREHLQALTGGLALGGVGGQGSADRVGGGEQ